MDPTVDLGKTINSRLKELREGDPGLEDVTEYLEVKDSRLQSLTKVLDPYENPRFSEILSPLPPFQC